MESKKSTALREKAKRILEERGRVTPDNANDLETLIEELNIYQIELEQQNDTLRETQLKLEESREQYVDLFTNAPVGYFILNEKMEILKINNFGAKLIGKPAKELTNHKITNYISADSQDVFYLHFNHIINKKTTDNCEIKIKNNSKKTHVNLESSFIQSSSGEKTIKMAATDISKQKKLYHNLNISEEKYKAIFNNSGDGFLVLTDKIEEANQQAANIYGYKTDELVGLNPGAHLSPETQPDGENSLKKAKINIQKALIEGYQKFYWQHIKKDGTLIDTEITLAVYSDEINPKLIAVVRDITAQKKYETLLEQKNIEIAAQNIEYGELNHELNETVALLKAANKEITESESKFRNYIESSPTPIIIFDHENNVTFCNTSAGKLTGFLDDCKTHFKQIFEEVEENKAFLLDIQAKGRIYNYKSVIKNANGLIKHVLISANKIEHNQIILFLTDITKQQQLDEQVYQEKEQWRRSFRAVSEGIMLSGSDYTIMLCNPAFASIVNHDKAESLIGAKTHFVIHGIHAPKKDCPVCSLHNLDEITQIQYYEPHLKKHLKVTSIPVHNEKGEIDFFVNTFQDMTSILEAKNAIKDNETRLQFALEGAYEGMWDWNIKTGEVIYNDIWAEMLGYKLDEITPNINSWNNLFHPDDKENIMQILQAHLDGKTERYESEHRLKTKSGEYKWILDKGKVVEWDEEGNPLRVIGTHLDISRQKQTEKELKLAKEKAEIADKLKTAFLANMSHEIRTPMNGIVGFTELLRKKDYTHTKRDRIFNIIQSSSQQLLQLINDIVDISKIEANQLSIYKEKFILDEILKDIEEITKLELQKKKKEKTVKFILDFPKKSEPIKIFSSTNRIRQIIMNLINNSIKFTNDGFIKLGYSKISKTHIEIYVEDTGIGISEEAEKIIFDRFMQASHDTAKKYGGTGLGLFITKQLVSLLNGEISLKSESNKGSKFTIKLPIDNSNSSANKSKKLENT